MEPSNTLLVSLLVDRSKLANGSVTIFDSIGLDMATDKAAADVIGIASLTRLT